MKKTNIVREANIGTNLELTNIELTVIKTKWSKITTALSEFKKLDSELVVDIAQFSGLIEKLCGDVLSLKETSEELFSSEPISDEEMNDIIAASTGAYDSMEDEERSERIHSKGSIDV